MGAPAGAVSLMWGEAISYAATWRKRGAGPGESHNASPTPPPQALARLTGPPEEFGSWPEIPALDLGRCEGGSANLAAALGVWQTRDFSSALCSAKLKMCLARNPSLIFKPLCVFFLRKCDPHVFDLFLFNSSNRIRSCNDEWEQC